MKRPELLMVTVLMLAISGGCGAMPMFLAGREPNRVAEVDNLDQRSVTIRMRQSVG